VFTSEPINLAEFIKKRSSAVKEADWFILVLSF